MIEPLENRTLFATVAVADMVEQTVASGLNRPTAMQFAPDGRLFVAEQGGTLRVVRNGTLLPTPFLSLNVNSTGERGLLGVAFDPNFADNGHVYVYHTVPSPLHNRVTRFTADPQNPDVAAAGPGVPILDLDSLNATNHNGGAIHFGPDGKLYVAVGENAVPQNAQTLANRHGKMLRINPDGSIPTDNPFYNQATGVNRSIWALGLRNPYTFAFQPGTGRMFINDVGQSSWEEINDGVAGANYGWSTTEGPTGDARFRGPVFAYRAPASGSDPLQTGHAITGGTFYNPPVAQFAAEFVGDYFYADYGRGTTPYGWIRRYDPASNTTSLVASQAHSVVDLKTAPDGSLYYLERGTGAVKRIRANVTTPSVPDLEAASDLGQSDTDNITSRATPTFTGRGTPNSRVRIVMDGTTVVATANVAADGTFRATPTAGIPHGTHRFTAVGTNAEGLASDPSGGLVVTVDLQAPTLLARQYDYETGPNALRFRFSEDVGRSLSGTNASASRLPRPGDPGANYVASSLTFDPATNDAVYSFNDVPAGLLPNGNYVASFSPTGVADVAGNRLAGGTSFDFFVLHGDLNRDFSVNGSDFAILATHFGRTSQQVAGADVLRELLGDLLPAWLRL